MKNMALLAHGSYRLYPLFLNLILGCHTMETPTIGSSSIYSKSYSRSTRIYRHNVYTYGLRNIEGSMRYSKSSNEDT